MFNFDLGKHIYLLYIRNRIHLHDYLRDRRQKIGKICQYMYIQGRQMQNSSYSNHTGGTASDEIGLYPLPTRIYGGLHTKVSQFCRATNCTANAGVLIPPTRRYFSPKRCPRSQQHKHPEAFSNFRSGQPQEQLGRIQGRIQRSNRWQRLQRRTRPRSTP